MGVVRTLLREQGADRWEPGPVGWGRNRQLLLLRGGDFG